MTFPKRSRRNFRFSYVPWILAAVALAAVSGCSDSRTTSGSGSSPNHILPSGASVSGWLVVPSGGTHSSTATQDYIANGVASGCTECHGSDLKGGISGTSCFGNPAGCHHGPVTGWVAVSQAAQQHGLSAKRAPGSSGFAACQICHASDFSGGGTNVSCMNNGASCHGAVASPHPRRPWRGAPYTHTDTNEANAPVCHQCHAYAGTANPNNPHVPPSPAPAGTAPGCYNGTMCHNEAIPHPVGIPDWYATPPAAQVHGSVDNGAKGAPGPTTGFAYCQNCHGGEGSDFAGGPSNVSCTNNPNAACHGTGVASPHPSQWVRLPTDNYAHTNTAVGNAPVCAFCHTAGDNSPIAPPSPPAPAGSAPGCFNGTLCHAGVAPHPVPFNDPIHYDTTSTTFQGATYPPGCVTCHDEIAPSTKVGPVCQTCHAAASPLSSANCTSCHASPPDGGAGAAYANIAGAHAVHLALDNTGSPVTCDTCHNGLGPTLANTNHYERAKSRVAPGDAAFTATYDARTGASSFDNSAALSCSNVSCHGGQATPNWQTGALDVNTQCASCHTVPIPATPQFNGPTSANHNRPQHQVPCTFCHNTAALAVNHFTNLSTPALEGPASATIGGTGTAITSYVPATRSCTPACHGTETW